MAMNLPLACRICCVRVSDISTAEAAETAENSVRVSAEVRRQRSPPRAASYRLALSAANRSIAGARHRRRKRRPAMGRRQERTGCRLLQNRNAFL